MIDYNELKKVLSNGIYDDLGYYLVDLESGDPRPDRQDDIESFISHKFTTPYAPQKGYEINNGDTLTFVSLPTMTLSLTCYAKNKGDALNLAHKLKQWFQFHGYEYLKDNGLVISNIESIQDRTIFLDTGYDQRVGFDVTLRVVDEQTRKIETIERVELNERLIGE